MKKIVIGIVLYLLFGLGSVSGAINNISTSFENNAIIPLSVAHRSNFERTEYVSYGVPLAQKHGVTDTSALKITSDIKGDNIVPAQFDVIARYNGTPDNDTKAVRSLLCTFQATVPAAGSAVYYLHTKEGNGNASGRLLASQDSDAVNINTGIMSVDFKKSRGFNFFDHVTVNGVELIRRPGTDGIVLVSDNFGTQSTLYSSYFSRDTPSVAVEINGPLMAILRVDGFFEDADGNRLIPATSGSPEALNGLSYTVRYKLFKAQRRIHTTVTVKNENPGQVASGETNKNAEIDYLYIRTTMAGMETPSAVRFSGWQDVSAPSGVYSVYQGHGDNQASEADTEATPNFNYTILQDTTRKSGGQRYDGYAAMGDANGGLMLSSRWFWQNWPKQISFDTQKKESYLYLWPDQAQDHLFLGAAWKTHELIYEFHDNVSSDYDFRNELASLKDPLKIFTNTLHTSEFFDFIPPGNFTTDVSFMSDEESLDGAISRWNNRVRAKFDSSYSTHGTYDYDLTDYRELRPISEDEGAFNGPINWYGWLNFGDMVRAKGYGFGGLQYGWDYIPLMHGHRFRDLDMIETGEQAVRKYGDQIIVHNPDSRTIGVQASNADLRNIHGCQRGEYGVSTALFNWSSSLFGNYHNSMKHYWPRGTFFQYLMTGDRYYMDVITHIGDFILYNFSDFSPSHGLYSRNSSSYMNCHDNLCTYWQNMGETRSYMRAAVAAAELYKITGNTNFLDTCQGIIKNALFYNEILIDNERQGRFAGEYDAARGINKEWLFYDVLCIKPLIISYYEMVNAGRTDFAQEIKATLLRMADFFEKDVYTHWVDGDCGTYGTGENASKYFPFIVMNTWNAVEPWNGGYPDRAYSFVTSDLFAFSFVQTGKQKHLNMARHIFYDFNHYTASGAWQDIDTTPNAVAGFADPSILGSGWMKDGKTIEKPLFYLWMENSIANQQINPEISPPRNLKIK